jgi:sigma-E factor negative regulatory protein RseC
MAEQIGIVVDNETNGLARVLTDRKGACSGCHTGPSKCRSCLTTSGKLESTVINPIGAGAGDVVRITIAQKDLFRGAALMYLLPIATLILGAVGGLWWGGTAGWGDGASVIGGLVGLGLGFWAVIRLGRSRRFSSRMTPVITAVVTPSDQSKQPAAHPVKPLQESCCH